MMKTPLVLLAVMTIFVADTVFAQSPEGNILKGKAYQADGDTLRAEAQYLLAIEQASESGEAHFRLGEIHLDRKHYRKAIAYFGSALSLGYREPLVFVELAFAFRGRGDLDGAIRTYREFIGSYPDFPEAHLGLGGLYDAKGMKKEAEVEYTVYRKLKHVDPNPAKR